MTERRTIVGRLVRLESRAEARARRAVFYQRLALYSLAAAVLVGGSLFAGMAGYHHYEHLDWLDAFLNAAMLLGGMGPVEQPLTPGGKIFAGIYALYSGMIFLVSVGLVLTPVAHRFFHTFHLESDGDGG